ncbi:Uncharacterized protein GBIM_12191 [Gryllus bimaculatus]|nr:Uncharacterized protein GBIM_12191 [Gryllus bimaculatus]
MVPDWGFSPKESKSIAINKDYGKDFLGANSVKALLLVWHVSLFIVRLYMVHVNSHANIVKSLFKQSITWRGMNSSIRTRGHMPVRFAVTHAIHKEIVLSNVHIRYKADQQVDSDCKAVKSEWIEKGEKLTTEYLKDLSKKLGREVTLVELKEREAEKNRRLTEDVDQVKKRHCRKQEHDYHSKVGPEDDEQLEEEADEPTAVLLSVAQEPTSTSCGNIVGNPIPGLSQTHVLQGVTINRNTNTQRTLFIQTPRETDIQSVLSDKVQKDCCIETPSISGQNSIQFCVNEQMPLDDQVPFHVIYHSTPQQSSNNSQENVSYDLNNSKYINNFNFVEVKGDATSNPTVVVIINTDHH